MNYVTITDQVELTVEDRVLNESSRLLGQNLAQTMDEVTRSVLNSTSSVLQCANGVNGGTPTELTQADIDSAVQTLISNDAEMITEVIEASDKFSTAAVRPSFMGFIHADLLDDLGSVSSFLSSSNYPAVQKAMAGEWGSTFNVRWLYSSVGEKSSQNVYSNFVIGKEAYGVVHLGSDQGEFYVEPLGSGGSADPLHQRGSVGKEPAHSKSVVIDLEAYGEIYGDKAQAGNFSRAA